MIQKISYIAKPFLCISCLCCMTAFAMDADAGEYDVSNPVPHRAAASVQPTSAQQDAQLLAKMTNDIRAVLASFKELTPVTYNRLFGTMSKLDRIGVELEKQRETAAEFEEKS